MTACVPSQAYTPVARRRKTSAYLLVLYLIRRGNPSKLFVNEDFVPTTEVRTD
jgi:hypothetical protein